MIIKKIKEYKSKVVLTLANKSKLEVSKEAYPNFYLYEGKDLSSKEIKEIKDFSNVSALLSYALKKREKKLYSEYKMREELYKKEANKKQVDKVIKLLKGYDLIDDKAFIEEYISYYNEKNYGKNKILNKLSEKGIFKDVLDKIMFPYAVEIKKAKNSLKKLEKQYDKYNDVEKRKHIYNALISRGFDLEVASSVTKEIKPSTSKEENNKLEKDFDKYLIKYKKSYKGKELKSKIVTALLTKGYKYNDINVLVERKHL